MFSGPVKISILTFCAVQKFLKISEKFGSKWLFYFSGLPVFWPIIIYVLNMPCVFLNSVQYPFETFPLFNEKPNVAPKPKI